MKSKAEPNDQAAPSIDPDRLQIVYRPIAELIPYKNNARTHSKSQLDLLRKLLLKFGWTNPVLLDGAGMTLEQLKIDRGVE